MSGVPCVPSIVGNLFIGDEGLVGKRNETWISGTCVSSCFTDGKLHLTFDSDRDKKEDIFEYHPSDIGNLAKLSFPL